MWETQVPLFSLKGILALSSGSCLQQEAASCRGGRSPKGLLWDKY
jgi:hypothetical protein